MNKLLKWLLRKPASAPESSRLMRQRRSPWLAVSTNQNRVITAEEAAKFDRMVKIGVRHSNVWAPVWFTNRQLFGEFGMEICAPDDLPDQWWPGYDWLDLCLFQAAICDRLYLQTYGRSIMIGYKDWANKTKLLAFVRALGDFRPEDKLYLIVWPSLAKQLPVRV